MLANLGAFERSIVVGRIEKSNEHMTYAITVVDVDRAN